MKRKRNTTLNLRVSEDERDKIHAVADAQDETVAQLIRRFIRQRYEAQFGDAAPAPKKSTAA